jgi:Domain of unknown function (DUF4388)
MSVTMSLAGTFDGNDFAEVVELLSRRACTGKFQVRAQSLNASVHLFEGQAVGVDVVIGAWRDGRRDLEGELEEVCLHALRSARGSFEFQPAETVEPPREPRVKLGTVLASARRRLTAWQQVEKVIPSLSLVPRLAESLRSEEMTVDQEQWRVIAAVDGRRSVSGLARRLGVDPLHLCQMLEPLVSAGAVQLDGGESRAKMPSEITRVSIDPASPAGPLEAGAGNEAPEAAAMLGRTEIPAFRVVPRVPKPTLDSAPAT